MVVAFRSLDTRLSNDVRQLHDAMWHPGWKGDRNKLRAALVKDARELDSFLRAGGRLQRHAVRLSNAWGTQEGAGESLFELLDHTYNLAAATEIIRRGDYKRAGAHIAEAVESMSIGVCAAADSFPLVEDWEGGKIDFETYASRLADTLEGKGIERAGVFKRLLLAARGFGKPFDKALPRAEQELGAIAALGNASWLAMASISVREAIGRAPMFPYDDYAAVIRKVLARV